MIYDHIGGFRDSLKQYLALQFCRKRNKVISVLTETHINHDQIHNIWNNWLGSNFSSPGNSITKGCLFCSIWILRISFIEIGTYSKGRFASFKFTPSNDRVLCVYAPSGYSTREQLAMRCFFQGLQTYVENKNKGNENIIILGDFNCTMDKMDRDGENKAQRFIGTAPIMPCQNTLWIMG